MSTKSSIFSLTIILSCVASFYGQTNTRVGILPSINYNKRLSNLWELNFRAESRHFFFQRDASQTGVFKYDYSLTDVSTLIARKVGLSSKLVAGALLRLEPEETGFRTIQQFIFQSEVAIYRVVSRIATDQTFSSLESPEFRLRYRISSEIPFSGQKLDKKELYLKVNIETINSMQGKEYDLEFRFVPNIGYLTAKEHKIELGLDNRLVSFIYNEARFSSWITLNFFF